MALPVVSTLNRGVNPATVTNTARAQQRVHIATSTGDLIHYARFPGVTNQSVAIDLYCERGVTITSIQVGFTSRPSSAGGTYLLTASAEGNNLFSAASFNLETTVSNVYSSVTLTGTTAHLTIPAGGVISLTFTSNTTDLVCAGPEILVTWTLA